MIIKDSTLKYSIRGTGASEVKPGIDKSTGQSLKRVLQNVEWHRKKWIFSGKEKGKILKQYSGRNSYRNAIMPFVPREVNLDLESKMRIRQDDLSEQNYEILDTFTDVEE